MGRIVRRPRAIRDLAKIALYIAQFDRRAADGLLDRIGEKLLCLADSPLVGSPQPQLGHGLKTFSVRPYTIIYRPLHDGIELIRVLHGARDRERLMRGEYLDSRKDPA